MGAIDQRRLAYTDHRPPVFAVCFAVPRSRRKSGKMLTSGACWRVFPGHIGAMTDFQVFQQPGKARQRAPLVNVLPLFRRDRGTAKHTAKTREISRSTNSAVSSVTSCQDWRRWRAPNHRFSISRHSWTTKYTSTYINSPCLPRPNWHRPCAVEAKTCHLPNH